jgi:hypothetical protein
MNKIGQSEADSKLEAIQKCRDIVHEIMNLNPSQNQLLMIIQFLALELHDHEQMVELVAATKEYMQGKNVLFLPNEEK